MNPRGVGMLHRKQLVPRGLRQLRSYASIISQIKRQSQLPVNQSWTSCHLSLQFTPYSWTTFLISSCPLALRNGAPCLTSTTFAGSVYYSCRFTLYLGFAVQKSLHLRRIGVRQTDFTQVMEDRTGSGVATSLPNQSPNGCLGQQSPHLARMGQQSPHLARMGQQFAGGVMEQKAIYVGWM